MKRKAILLRARAREFLVWRCADHHRWEISPLQIAHETGLSHPAVTEVLRRKPHWRRALSYPRGRNASVQLNIPSVTAFINANQRITEPRV